VVGAVCRTRILCLSEGQTCSLVNPEVKDSNVSPGWKYLVSFNMCISLCLLFFFFFLLCGYFAIGLMFDRPCEQ